MSNYSSHYILGDVNEWSTHHTFTVSIPKSARAVGVVYRNNGYSVNQLQLICVESTSGDQICVPRTFIATTTSVSGESLMYVGFVQLQKAHTHQVDIGQSVLYDDPNAPNYQEQQHSHAQYSVTDNVWTPLADPLMVFEVSD